MFCTNDLASQIDVRDAGLQIREDLFGLGYLDIRLG
jgi:hypothetical protein